MKIALIGYGKMGHAVEAEALAQGHEVTVRIDSSDDLARLRPTLREADVAIEFTTPVTAVANIIACLEEGVPVVCGTTGWYDHYDRVAATCLATGGTLLTATNFSIGMNIMFALNRRLATLMRGRNYEPSIAEVHHIHKLDSPSGTALTLRSQMAESLGLANEGTIPIHATRLGEVPGTHTVTYHSAADTITLTHEAHNRSGLAQGALIAAAYAIEHKGLLTMADVLGENNKK